jgi:broad specificity phosphatase PhoE
MTLLHLIRHARSTWNTEGRLQGQADPPLDATGQQQVLALADFLKDEPFQAIYSSPLRRARLTADALAAGRNLPVQLDARLMERHLGDWTGLNGEDARAQIAAFHEKNQGGDWRVLGPPGGESEAALMTRAAGALSDIIAAHPEGQVAVVSHGGTLRAYLLFLFGLPPESQRISFSFENTSFARVRVLDGHVRLIGLGENRPQATFHPLGKY